MSNINTSDIAAMVDEILVEGGDDGFDIGTDEMNLITDYPSKNEIEDLLDEFHKYVGADEEELSIGKNDIIALESPNDESDLEIEPPILLEESENEESQDIESQEHEYRDIEKIDIPILIEEPEQSILIEEPEKSILIEEPEEHIIIEDPEKSIIIKNTKEQQFEDLDDFIPDFSPVFIEDNEESIIGNSEITDKEPFHKEIANEEKRNEEKRYEKINKLTKEINEIFDNF